jgi:hypothetical protein
MGLLEKLFGSEKRAANPYLEAGCQLIPKIADLLNLTEWRQGKLPGYTPQEVDAINREVDWFQKMADSVASEQVPGSEMLFHPEAIDPVQRMCVATALEDLAGSGWRYSFDEEKLPENWKSDVSTYMKSWVCSPNPIVLLEMAELLARAGHKGEARKALQVVLLFPTYGHDYYCGREGTEQLVNDIVEDAQKGLRNL